MLIVIALALAIGLVGGWVYAGCPLPRTLSGAFSRRPLTADRSAVDAVSPASGPGASPARP
jgi:hypothetical protein